MTPGNALGRKVEATLGIPVSKEVRALDLLKRPEVDYQRLVEVEGIGPGVEDEQLIRQLEVQARYAGYLVRQQ